MTNENPFYKYFDQPASPPKMPLPLVPVEPDPWKGKREPTIPSPDVRPCPQVITWARSPSGEEKSFPTPCDVPSGWVIFVPSDNILQKPEKSAPAPTPPKSAPAPTPPSEGTLGDYLMGLATGSSVPATGTPSVVVTPDQQPRSLLLPLVGALALGGIVWYTMKQRKEGKAND